MQMFSGLIFFFKHLFKSGHVEAGGERYRSAVAFMNVVERGRNVTWRVAINFLK